MSDSNEQVQAEDLVDNIELESNHSKEDKFFGVKTEISTEKPDVKVEVINDIPEEDRRPPKQETKEEPVDDETLDKEISDYSERAGKRISKIKYEYHEERRAKEAAQRESNEAVNRLKTMMLTMKVMLMKWLKLKSYFLEQHLLNNKHLTMHKHCKSKYPCLNSHKNNSLIQICKHGQVRILGL